MINVTRSSARVKGKVIAALFRVTRGHKRNKAAIKVETQTQKTRLAAGVNGEQFQSMLRDTHSPGAGQAPAAGRLAVATPDKLSGTVNVRPLADGRVPGHEAGHHQEDALAGGGEAGDLPEASFKEGDATRLPGLHAAGRHAGDLAGGGDVHADASIRVDVQSVGSQVDKAGHRNLQTKRPSVGFTPPS